MSETQKRGLGHTLRPALARARASLKKHMEHGGELPNDTAAVLLRDPETLRHFGRLRHCEKWANSIQVMRIPPFIRQLRMPKLKTSEKDYALRSML